MNHSFLANFRRCGMAAFLLLVASLPFSQAEKPDVSHIYGRIQFVDAFPNYKVKVTDAFADLQVQTVTAFADKPGKWQIVDSFPDFKIQTVDSFPDFTIKYVTAFPGPK